MIDHVTIGVSDREATRRFYSTVLPVLGYELSVDPAFSRSGETSRSRRRGRNVP